jgi:hypothetical protein
MRRVGVPQDTSFFARVTSNEMEQILEPFMPVLLDVLKLSETRFMAEIERFRI